MGILKTRLKHEQNDQALFKIRSETRYLEDKLGGDGAEVDGLMARTRRTTKEIKRRRWQFQFR